MKEDAPQPLQGRNVSVAWFGSSRLRCKSFALFTIVDRLRRFRVSTSRTTLGKLHGEYSSAENIMVIYHRWGSVLLRNLRYTPRPLCKASSGRGARSPCCNVTPSIENRGRHYHVLRRAVVLRPVKSAPASGKRKLGGIVAGGAGLTGAILICLVDTHRHFFLVIPYDPFFSLKRHLVCLSQ